MSLSLTGCEKDKLGGLILDNLMNRRPEPPPHWNPVLYPSAHHARHILHGSLHFLAIA